MPYQPTTWKNNDFPAINADNLNKIEACLVELTDRDTLNVTATGVTWSAGKLARLGHNCMFDLEFTAPITTGGEAEIFQFPVGYRPYMGFGLSIINPNDGSYVGICEYDAVNNILFFRSIIQDTVPCRFYCCYVTADTQITT